jgi:hypothetical protein
MIDGGLRKLFRANLPAFHWMSCETGLTEQGVPDSNGCIDGIEFWIEFKKTATNKVPLRSEQVGWLMRRSRAGGRTFVAIRYHHTGGPLKGPAIDKLIIYPGASAKQLALTGLRNSPLFESEGGPSKWRWGEVGRVLVAYR